MNNKNLENAPQDIVDHAAAALRHTPMPPGPSADLINRTLMRAGDGDGMGAGETSLSHKERDWWNMRVTKGLALAAGLLIVAGTILLGSLLFHGSRIAFADVVEQIKTIHAVRYKMIAEIANSDGKTSTSESEALVVASGWTVVKTANMTVIMSTEHHRMVTLNPQLHQAMVVEMANQPAAAGPRVMNLLDMFKNVDSKEGKPLGEREINGHNTRGFAVSNGGLNMRVWADVKTQLPILVEATPNAVFLAGGNYTMRDFDWNPTYDPAELSVDVPAGYQPLTTTLDVSQVSEKDIVTMLKTCAETNGGKFPDDVGIQGYSRLIATKIAERQRTETAGMSNDEKAKWTQKQMGDMMATMTPIARGWSFMANTTFGDSWTYAGADVSLGEKGHPILWYKSKPAGTWRVIDADLTIHDGKESDLPHGTPVAPSPLSPAQTAPAK